MNSSANFEIKPMSEIPQSSDKIVDNFPCAASVMQTELYLPQLWDASLSASMAAALMAYRSDGGDSIRVEEPTNQTAMEFRRLLIADNPQLPETTAGIYMAVVRAAWQILRRARLDRQNPHWIAYFLVALRPVRRFQAGILTAEICAALHDFCWNGAIVKLKKPDRYRLEDALALTLAALPAGELGLYWENLQSDNPQIRQSMRYGLKFFRSAHAAPHLLATLEKVRDHDIRAEIVDILEQIGEPSAIPVLTRLKKETAVTDWPLSRQIGRAIKVIERQDRNLHYGTLLRPSEAPPTIVKELLRPAGFTPFHAERDRAELLRSPAPSEDAQNGGPPENAK